MFTQLLFPLFSALVLAFSHSVNAAPIQPVELIAFAPTITSPSTGTVWVAGSQQEVTWLTNNVPTEAQNYTVTILLGYFANNSENLDYQHPLATQVPIMAGKVSLTVPADEPYRNNYTVVVIGDSGNASPAFTIMPSVALH